MKKIIISLLNIWKIEDLRARILFTFICLLIYRIGSFVVLPGVDSSFLQNQNQGGLLGLLDMFAGGSFSRASVFALGVMPYISASIIVQLFGISIPFFQKLQKEGESGRMKLNQITRYFTVIITFFQAIGYVKSQINPDMKLISEPFFTIIILFFLTAGTMFVVWLGERITDKGIGNGVSMIIMVGIIAQFPFSFISEFNSRLFGHGGLIPFVVEIFGLFLIVLFTILVIQGVRKVPVQYAKKNVGRVINRQQQNLRQYIPIKVNSAGVMPIIFAQAVMFIPATLIQFFPDIKSSFFISLTNYTSFSYNLLFSLMIIVFTFFYTAIMINPVQMADDMKKNGGFVPGIKPGFATGAFIDAIISKITLPSALFLAFIAVLPSVAVLFGINSQFAHFYGGTSLLILVGVVLDTLQQIKGYLLMNHYDGLMKPGRINKNRSISTLQMVSSD